MWKTLHIYSIVTPYMVDEQYGNLKSSVFFIWGILCATGFVYLYFLVSETKGLSLELVDQMMKESTPRTSVKWKPKRMFGES